jgi:hypothetical protein
MNTDNVLVLLKKYIIIMCMLSEAYTALLPKDDKAVCKFKAWLLEMTWNIIASILLFGCVYEATNSKMLSELSS